MMNTIPDSTERRDIVAYLETLPRPEAGAGAADARPVVTPATGMSDPGDWRNDAPGVGHLISLKTLPAPYATASAGNGARSRQPAVERRLEGPSGLHCSALRLRPVRAPLMRIAPNGDIFIAETRSGRLRVLRAADGAKPAFRKGGLLRMASAGRLGSRFFPLGPDPRWIYVGYLNSVVRFPYRNGDLKARGPPRSSCPDSPIPRAGIPRATSRFRWTAGACLSRWDPDRMSRKACRRKCSAEIRPWEAAQGLGAAWGSESRRADILVTDPEGHSPVRVFATGLRNAVGLAVDPATGRLWASTNERDGLGDDLVPDYITRVRENGFYGWPWYYLGSHEDPAPRGRKA